MIYIYIYIFSNLTILKINVFLNLQRVTTQHWSTACGISQVRRRFLVWRWTNLTDPCCARTMYSGRVGHRQYEQLTSGTSFVGCVSSSSSSSSFTTSDDPTNCLIGCTRWTAGHYWSHSKVSYGQVQFAQVVDLYLYFSQTSDWLPRS